MQKQQLCEFCDVEQQQKMRITLAIIVLVTLPLVMMFFAFHDCTCVKPAYDSCLSYYLATLVMSIAGTVGICVAAIAMLPDVNTIGYHCQKHKNTTLHGEID